MTKSLLGLIMAMLMWACSFSIMKILVTDLGPVLTVWLRLSIAGILLLFVWRKIRVKIHSKIDAFYIVILALCEPCLYFLFESYALLHTTAAEASMIMSVLPIFVIVAARFFLNEYLSIPMIFGAIISLVGVIIMNISFEVMDSFVLTANLYGNFLELLAVVCATVYSLLARVLIVRYSGWFLTAIQSLFGSVFFALLWFFIPQPEPQWYFNSVLMIIGLAVGVNIFATYWYNSAYRTMTASQVAMWLNVLPLLSVLCAWIVLDEALYLTQYLGGVLILMGVLLSQYPSASKKWCIND